MRNMEKLYGLSARLIGEAATNIIVMALMVVLLGLVCWFLAEKVVQRDEREFRTRFCAEAVKRGLLKECR